MQNAEFKMQNYRGASADYNADRRSQNYSFFIIHHSLKKSPSTEGDFFHFASAAFFFSNFFLRAL